MAKEGYSETSRKMNQAIQQLKSELIAVRAGRANPKILDKIMVDYYGSPTPLNQVAGISVPEARVIVISPWESKLVSEIEKAIHKSDIGINPNSDGKVIRLSFPPLTEERRKELSKSIKKMGEDTKVQIRSIRRDEMDTFKAMKKASEITEDDLKIAEKDIQGLTDKYVSLIDDLIEQKESEIMEV